MIFENKDLTLLRPNKGANIILMDCIYYINRLSTIHSHEHKFSKESTREDISRRIKQTQAQVLGKMLKDELIVSGNLFKHSKLSTSDGP